MGLKFYTRMNYSWIVLNILKILKNGEQFCIQAIVFVIGVKFKSSFFKLILSTFRMQKLEVSAIDQEICRILSIRSLVLLPYP